MRFEDIFVLKDGVVELVSPKDTFIPEVRTIIKRDRGQHKIKGDPEGRYKKYAFMELSAVYYIADYRSPGRKQGLENEELLKFAIMKTGLPETWIPDKTVLDFISYYEDNISAGPAAKVVVSLRNTFHLAVEVVDTIRGDFRKKLDNKATTDDEKKNMLLEIKELLSMSAGLSKQIKDLQEAEAMLMKEEDDIRLGRGNVVITSSMDYDDEDDD